MKKILIKFPVRERVVKFFKTLDIYYEMSSGKVDLQFMINLDYDDFSMNNPEILKRLSKYKNLNVCFNDNRNKIEAINANFQEMEKMEFDIILLASDDMVPIVKGYDEVIVNEMEKYFPNNDGILWFYDGNWKSLNTLSILGRKYFERFGYIYHHSYKSFWCDNEFTDIGKQLNRQVFIDRCIIEHKHPDFKKNKYDNLSKKNAVMELADRANFKLRKSIGFQNRRLTIGISIDAKNENLAKEKVEKLKKQISEQNVLFKEVQILINISEKEIEQKRVDLIQRSDCKYICFVEKETKIKENFLQKCLRSISYDGDYYKIDGIEVFKQDSFSDEKCSKIIKNFDKHNKKVISFSLWGENQRYLVGAVENAKLRSLIYPEWVCRYYVDNKVSPKVKSELRKLGSEIVEMNMDSDGYFGLFWRFYIAKDKDVKIFVVRDTDSRINMREADAVREWESSDKNFHSMRDHKFHNINVLGGMWGAKRNFLPGFQEILMENLKSISSVNHRRGKYFDTDQKFLNGRIWPQVQKTAMIHDDVDRFRQNALPFKTKLGDGTFVGQQWNERNQPLQPE